MHVFDKSHKSVLFLSVALEELSSPCLSHQHFRISKGITALTSNEIRLNFEQFTYHRKCGDTRTTKYATKQTQQYCVCICKRNKNAKALRLHSVILLCVFSRKILFLTDIFNGNRDQYEKSWIYS